MRYNSLSNEMIAVVYEERFHPQPDQHSTRLSRRISLSSNQIVCVNLNESRSVLAILSRSWSVSVSLAQSWSVSESRSALVVRSVSLG